MYYDFYGYKGTNKFGIKNKRSTYNGFIIKFGLKYDKMSYKNNYYGINNSRLCQT
jgi:hypothetical protein